MGIDYACPIISGLCCLVDREPHTMHGTFLRSLNNLHPLNPELLVVLPLQLLCATRFLVGIGQGCVDSVIVDSVSRWSPTEERSSASGFAFNGYVSKCQSVGIAGTRTESMRLRCL